MSNNNWVQHCKEFSQNHNMSYRDCLSCYECKTSYKNKKLKTGGDMKNKELKDLMDATYDNNKTEINITPWEKDIDLTTFNTKVFYNPETQQAVVSHKGTEGLNDWGNNLTYAIGGVKSYKKTTRYLEAKQIQTIAEEKYGAKNITTIGHSQGGVLAELVGKNTPIITYNKMTSLGVENKIKQNQLDIRTKGDIPSSLNPFQKIKNKNKIVLDYNDWNPRKNHSTEGLLKFAEEQNKTGGSIKAKKINKTNKVKVKPVMSKF